LPRSSLSHSRRWSQLITLQRTLDLSFVREFVQETYVGKGRPSIDPVVFFKLQLVMFFEDIRSEARRRVFPLH
jgi:transposase